MSSFSRREFLRRSGAAIIGASSISTGDGLPSNSSSGSIPDLNGPLTTGRAFRRESVYTNPDASSPVADYVAPDGVYLIVQAAGAWYQVAGGYVRREAMQPIQPYCRPPIFDSGEIWAEVIAPVSSIREWCAGEATILTRL